MNRSENELFIRAAFRPDLTAVFGPVEGDNESGGIFIEDPNSIIRFSSCKESSTDGKEDTKKKEIGKDDKGLTAAANTPSGPVTDGKSMAGSIIPASLSESAQANTFA